MQWSPLYTIYSYSLGIMLQSSSYWGAITDQVLTSFNQSIRVRSKTDIYVNVADVNLSQLSFFWGVFVTPLRLMEFFEYVKIISQVDEVLLTKHSKWEPLKEFCQGYGWAAASALALSGDFTMYVFTVGRKLGVLWIIKLYGPYYMTCLILLNSEYSYAYMGGSLKKRIERLNEVLENFYLVGNKISVGKRGRNRFGSFRKTRNIRPVSGNVGLTLKNPDTRTNVLMNVYLQVIEATNLQNRILGMAGVVIVFVGFYHLLTAAYFLLSELIGKRQHPVGFKVFLSSFLTARLLLVIEPWYRCCMM